MERARLLQADHPSASAEDQADGRAAPANADNNRKSHNNEANQAASHSAGKPQPFPSWPINSKVNLCPQQPNRSTSPPASKLKAPTKPSYWTAPSVEDYSKSAAIPEATWVPASDASPALSVTTPVARECRTLQIPADPAVSMDQPVPVDPEAVALQDSAAAPVAAASVAAALEVVDAAVAAEEATAATNSSARVDAAPPTPD
jgi:hypothetical protein